MPVSCESNIVKSILNDRKIELPSPSPSAIIAHAIRHSASAWRFGQTLLRTDAMLSVAVALDVTGMQRRSATNPEHLAGAWHRNRSIFLIRHIRHHCGGDARPQ
jgi:hypothetical protein